MSVAETETPVIAAAIDMASAKLSNGAYALSWRFDGEAVPVTVSVTKDADAETGIVIATGLLATDFTWIPQDGVAERHYFIITPENGTGKMVSTRLLPLEGGRNFRTLGGYETEDGKTVKWGKLFRSGVMDGLTQADYEYLSALGIKVLCDLRTAQERKEQPTEWAAGNTDYLVFPDPAQGLGSAFTNVFLDPEISPEKVRKAFGDAYYDMAHEQIPAFTVMFDKLASGEAPLAFNCSAGKDRTGIAAALILTVLGVPRETIVADYALSDVYVDYMAEFLNEDARKKAEEEQSPYLFLFQFPPEVIAPLMASYPEYIETFFADIEAEYGSAMAFLNEKVGLTQEEIENIRALYLEG